MVISFKLIVAYLREVALEIWANNINIGSANSKCLFYHFIFLLGGINGSTDFLYHNFIGGNAYMWMA